MPHPDGWNIIFPLYCFNEFRQTLTISMLTHSNHKFEVYLPPYFIIQLPHAKFNILFLHKTLLFLPVIEYSPTSPACINFYHDACVACMRARDVSVTVSACVYVLCTCMFVFFVCLNEHVYVWVKSNQSVIILVNIRIYSHFCKLFSKIIILPRVIAL